MLRGQLEQRKLCNIRAETVLDLALQDEATPNETRRRGLPALGIGASKDELCRDEHRGPLTSLLEELRGALKLL